MLYNCNTSALVFFLASHCMSTNTPEHYFHTKTTLMNQELAFHLSLDKCQSLCKRHMKQDIHRGWKQFSHIILHCNFFFYILLFFSKLLSQEFTTVGLGKDRISTHSWQDLGQLRIECPNSRENSVQSFNHFCCLGIETC